MSIVYKTNGVVITSTVVGDEVQFNSTDADYIDGIYGLMSIRWDFGDGHTSISKYPVHKYGMPGDYTVSCVYDSNFGCAVGAIDSSTIKVQKNLIVSALDKSYRVGTSEEQGIGPSEYTGTYWPQFPVGVGGDTCFDSKDQPHQIVYDDQWGFFAEISEPDGPTGSGLSRSWVDEDYTGALNEISSEIHLAELTATNEHDKIEHNESHFYFRPFDEDSRSVGSHDAYGYRNGQTVDVEWYLDGEQITYNGKTENITKTGEIYSDRKLLSKRERTVLKLSRAEYILKGYDQYWVQKDVPEDSDSNTISENTYQYNLSLMTAWITRGKPSALHERINNGKTTIITGSATKSYGADGNSNSAFRLTNTLTLTQALTSATLYLCYYTPTGGIQVQYKTNGGSTVTAIEVLNSNGTIPIYVGGCLYETWKCASYSLGSSITAIYINLSGTAYTDIFDLRIYANGNSISTSDWNYLYNDIKNNSANNVCPVW